MLADLCLAFLCLFSAKQFGLCDEKGELRRAPDMNINHSFALETLKRFPPEPHGTLTLPYFVNWTTAVGEEFKHTPNGPGTPIQLVETVIGYGFDELGRRMNFDKFLQHQKAYKSFSAAHYDSETCEGNADDESMFAGERVLLISVVHNRNEPWTLPCLLCSPMSVRQDNTKYFLYLPYRDPFRKWTHPTAYLSKETRADRVVHLMHKYWQLGLTGSKHNDVFMSSRNRFAKSAYFADRWHDTRRESSEANSRFGAADGRLLIDPDPSGNQSFFFHWNAMTVFCAQQVDRELRPSRVVINVDTLIHPEMTTNQRPESIFVLNRPESPSEQQESPRFTHFGSQGHYQRGSFNKINFVRYRLMDFHHLTNKSKLYKDGGLVMEEELNLQVNVTWQPWSCCSACCCKSREECGNSELIVDMDKCRLLKSYKRRVGHCTIRKINPDKKIDVKYLFPQSAPLNESIVNATEFFDVFKDFDRYLSSNPYKVSGIACFSTLLQTSVAWRYLEERLNRIFGYRNSTAKQTDKEGKFGPIGQFFQVSDCAMEDEQKRDCGVWQTCWQQALTGRHTVFQPAKGEGAIKQPKVALFVDPCKFVKFEDILLDTSSMLVKVHQGHNYRIVFVKTLQDIASVSWKEKVSGFSARSVPVYNESANCEQQSGPVLAVNGKDLLLLSMTESMASKSFSARPQWIQSGGRGPTRKIRFHFVSKKQPSTNFILYWLAGAIGGIILVISILFLVHRHQQRRRRGVKER